MTPRDDSRLTDQDRDRIVAAMRQTIAGWPLGHQAKDWDFDVLTRVGAHAIGCGLESLRSAESEAIRAMAVAAAREDRP